MKHSAKTRSRLGRMFRARRAAEVLEAALIIPILLSLSFGTVEVGWYFYVSHMLQGAAREGARARIPPGATDADALAAIDAVMATAPALVRNNYTKPATITFPKINGNDAVDVRVDADWSKVGISLFGVIGSSHKLSGEAVMRIEK